MTLDPSELDILIYWMKERDAIRVRKEQGLPRPWTIDPLLRDYRWCNVRRMDDLVSRELLASWYIPAADPVTDLVAAVLGRLVNWPLSLSDITGPSRFEIRHLAGARAKLHQRSAKGWKVFTGAYVVPGVPGFVKVDSVCNLVERVHEHAERIVADTARDTWANLIKVDGLGSFLAGQVVADLAHLSAGRSWPDRSSWAPLGPGSARGINRVMGLPKDRVVHQRDFEVILPALMLELRPRVLKLWEDRGLFAMDIQNCLCEFDKYRRLSLGEGTVRARYHGSGEPQAALL